ncbi:hypothetical protein B5X24_HaOG207708 [Helicoverpa armigera]|uniref:Retrotransposon gag domain-containing protein n=1 Tax=Helicoverpa armigera TaxID=29058 RepID=A0A2W1BHE3_HELAM|nr:hypothetical protein B5X24_HaOG207708 [Helicoverpa armigera]
METSHSKARKRKHDHKNKRRHKKQRGNRPISETSDTDSSLQRSSSRDRHEHHRSGRRERSGSRRERSSGRRKHRQRSRSRAEQMSSGSTSSRQAQRSPVRRSNTSDCVDTDNMTHLLLTKLVDTLVNNRPEGNKFPVLGNIIPDFDPMTKGQTIHMWLNKVEECARLYKWGDDQIIHYALPKLTGVARAWYQALPTMSFSWSEWKSKLLESFPSSDDYAELLTEMLSKRVKYNDSLEMYYFEKINLLTRCDIRVDDNSKIDKSNQKEILRVDTENFVTCNNNKYIMEMTVNGQLITGYIDLGSQCTLIRRNDANKLGIIWSYESNLPTMRGIGNNIVLPIGIAVVTLQIQGDVRYSSQLPNRVFGNHIRPRVPSWVSRL